jgi:hypothetical protein
MSIIIPIDLPGKYIGERVVVSCDFGKRMNINLGVGLTSPVVTAEVLTGVDASPSAILSGTPSIEGTKVKQLVIAGLNGVTYKLIFQVDTDEATPQRFIEELDLPVETP